MSNPPPLGPALRRTRRERDWTLDRLSSESGVSTSMLSEIERGDANPTFATLWNVTQALGVEIQALTDAAASAAEAPTIDLTARASTPTMSSPDGLVTIRALSPVQTADAVEWYEFDFEPGGVVRSAPHPSGTTEHLTILSGVVQVTSSEATETVADGATARYRGDVPHEIANLSTGDPARALVVVLGPAR